MIRRLPEAAVPEVLVAFVTKGAAVQGRMVVPILKSGTPAAGLHYCFPSCKTSLRADTCAMRRSVNPSPYVIRTH